MVFKVWLVVVLGVYFKLLQSGEYHESTFSILMVFTVQPFFVATGVHGLHALIWGMIF